MVGLELYLDTQGRDQGEIVSDNAKTQPRRVSKKNTHKIFHLPEGFISGRKVVG